MSRTFRVLATATAALLLSALSLTAVFVPLAEAGVSPAGPPVPVGHVPLVPRGARLLGPAPASTALRLSVTLAPRDPAALAAAVAAVSDPASPQYHHYLGKGAFAAEFGPTPATIAAVRDSIRAAGLTPGATAANGLSIPVRATVTQAEHAWGVSMDTYQLASGKTVLSNANPPRLGSTVASSVVGIVGLDGFESMQAGAATGTKSGPAGTTPSSPAGAGAIPGQPTACAGAVNTGAWTAGQIAQAYDFPPLYLAGSFGQNQTIDVYELSPYLASDISSYQTCYGTSVPVSQVPVDGGQSANTEPSGNGGLEVALDAEDVIGLDPKLAQVNIYDAPNCSSCSDQYDEWKAIADNDDASVVSTSWYACELGQTSFDNSVDSLFQQMAVQGQTVVGLTGDVGAADCSSGNPPVPYEAISFPSSSPNITAVGGTNLTAIGNPPATAPTETAWSGSGGGISGVYKLPAYQNGIVNSQSSGTPCANTSGNCRETPDVSADAGISYAMYTNGGWGGVIGTSASTPTWGALAALIYSSDTSCAVGFMNPTLYSIAAVQYTGGTGDYYNDVTSGNNDVAGVGYSAGTGYDMVTGLGSPVGANIAQTFCPRTATSTTIGTSGTPSLVGNSVTFTATVSPTDNGGTVAFYADGSSTAISGCAQVTLNGAHQAQCSTTALAIGDHTVVAVYSGDTTGYLGSTSGSVAERIQTNTNTAVAAAPDPSTYPTPVSFTATVSPSDGGGTVSFYLDGSSTALCSGVALTNVGGSFQAACSDSSPYPLAGSHSIAAYYSGDNFYLASHGSTGFTVHMALTAPPLANPTWETPYATTITATGGTGVVTFTKTGGTLPTGISLATNGLLSGTPTAKTELNQSFTFTVTATDSLLATGSQSYTIKLLSPCAAALTPYFLSVTAHAGNFTGFFCVNAAGTGTYAQKSGPSGNGTVKFSGSITMVSASGTNLALLGSQTSTYNSITETAPAPMKTGTFTLL